MRKYAIIVCRETGDFIDYANSKEEAEEMLSLYEKLDKDNNIYEENFYEIKEVNNN